MIGLNSDVVVLSDSIFCRGCDSHNSPSYMIMDAVNVNVHNIAADGMPVGRLSQSAWMPVAMCDHKTIINFLSGFYSSVECLIVMGGTNDFLHGAERVAKNYYFGLLEIGVFAKQNGIANVVFVSPLGVLSSEYNPNNNTHMPDLRAECVTAAAMLNSEYGGAFYIDGLSLMPMIPENYQPDQLHPSDAGRVIWVNNLIAQLQSLGVFPASY